MKVVFCVVVKTLINFVFHTDSSVNNSLNSNQSGTTASASVSVSMPNTPAKQRMNPVVVLEECAVDDYAPLFYSPGKCGFYSPREGFASYERLNAFRNVGRYVIELTFGPNFELVF